MAHAREQATVDRPIADVFEFLADGLNEPKWRADVVEVHLRSGDGRAVGSVWAQTMRGPGGRRIRGDYRITRSDPPVRLDFEVVAGPARPVGSFTLTEIGPARTEVSFALELQPTGLLKLMASAVSKQIAKEAAAIGNLPAAMDTTD